MSAWSLWALVFVATTALTGVVLYWLSASQWRVGRRLKLINQAPTAAESHPSERKERAPFLPVVLERLGYADALKQLLERAGLNWELGDLLALWAAAALACAITGWRLGGPLAAAIGIACACIGGWRLLKGLQNRRLRQFEKQLPDALMLMASSLRSGYGLLRSMQAIRDEMQPPISVEFGTVLDQTTVGLGMQRALTHLSQRVPLPDLEIAINAMLIHLEVGGNLSELLDTVAATLRERQRIHAEVETLTAEGRLSGVILFLLPIIMTVTLMFLNPAYMTVLLRTPFGHMLLCGAAILQTIGGVMIVRLLRIDF